MEVVLWDDRNTRVMAELRFKTVVRSVQHGMPENDGMMDDGWGSRGNEERMIGVYIFVCDIV